MTKPHWIKLEDLWLVYEMNKNTAYNFVHKHKNKPYINHVSRGKTYVDVGYLKRRCDIIDSIQDQLQEYVLHYNNTWRLVDEMIKLNPKWDGEKSNLSVFLSTYIFRVPVTAHNMFNRQWSQLAYKVLRTLRRLKHDT